MVFFQKLQVSGETQSYFVFPINWLVHRLNLANPTKLYTLYVTTLISSLRSVHYEFIPILDPLELWLLSIAVIPALPLLPGAIAHFPGFPKDEIIALGHTLNRGWNSRDQFKGFMHTLFALPREFALAFKFKSVVYVFDHFDVCDIVIPPSPRFNPTNDSVLLPDALWDEVVKGLYFVATRSDSTFFEIFPSAEFKQLPTDRLITDETTREIIVAQPPLTIKYSMCSGCPAYCALFDRVYEYVLQTQSKKDLKLPFSQLKSVVDTARHQILKDEVFRLCTLLALVMDADGIFGNSVMNELQWRSELNVKAKE
jgi:hypothetical protein